MEPIDIAYNALSRLQAGFDQEAREEIGPKVLELMNPYLNLEEITAILIKENFYYCATLWEDVLQVEEEWEDNGCKNDDDAVDYANEFANDIIERFPQLGIQETFCHRHKYSVAAFKIKEDEAK